MASGNGVFLKVDSVEPAYKVWPSPYDSPRVSGIKV